jgi:hypothetical protein
MEAARVVNFQVAGKQDKIAKFQDLTKSSCLRQIIDL